MTADVLFLFKLLQAPQVEATQQVDWQSLDIPQIYLAYHTALSKLPIQLILAQRQALQQLFDPLVEELAALCHCDETSLVGKVAIHPRV